MRPADYHTLVRLVEKDKLSTKEIQLVVKILIRWILDRVGSTSF